MQKMGPVYTEGIAIRRLQGSHKRYGLTLTELFGHYKEAKSHDLKAGEAERWSVESLRNPTQIMKREGITLELKANNRITLSIEQGEVVQILEELEEAINTSAVLQNEPQIL